MKILRTKPLAWLTFMSLIWLGLDLLSKWMATRLLRTPFSILSDWLYFYLHINEGIAFGWFFGKWTQIIISSLILVFIFTLIPQLISKKHPFLSASLIGMIIGGGLGNLTNRLFLGHVIDFIGIKPFPIFNVADIGITVGLILLLLIDLIDKEDKPNKK